MNMPDNKEELESIVMIDDAGDDIEFMIIDTLLFDGNRYILVVEKDDLDEEEPEAVILKELEDTKEDITYVRVEDEFEEVAKLFTKNNKDYDLQIDE